MTSCKAFLKTGRIFAATIIIIGGLFPPHQATGSYLLLCGQETIPRDVMTIPWIGCFSLSAGHSAIDTFSNQKVEVAVDAAGQETFTVNGTAITIRDPLATNLPYVRRSPLGYAICPDDAKSDSSCPSRIEVFFRNADKSILFVVSECLPPSNQVCAMTQKNWDFEQSRLASNQGQGNRPLNNPLVAMPPGPFGSWPEETRAPALRTLRFRCILLTTMAFAGPNVPKLSPEAMRNVAAAVVSGCVANAMPGDWPQRAAVLQQERSYIEKVGDVLPPSFDLDAIAKQIAEGMKRRDPESP
jgi:hypothetical protein